MRCFIFNSTVKTQPENTSLKLALISYVQNKKRHVTYLVKTHQLNAQNIFITQLFPNYIIKEINTIKMSKK